MERGRIQGLPKFFGYPLLSQERVKLRSSNFVGAFIGSIGTKPMKYVGNISRGCTVKLLIQAGSQIEAGSPL